MVSENTKESVAAAEAGGKTLGRPAALDEGEVISWWRRTARTPL